MKKVIHWIKENPLKTALFVGVAILLLLVFGRSGGSSGQSVSGSTGTSDAAIGAAAALQAKQIDASVQNNAISASITGKQLDNATQLALASMSAEVAKYQTANQTTVALAGIAEQSQVQLAGITAQTTLADLNFKTEQARIYSNLEMANITANTYTSITNAQAARDIAGIQAQVDIATAPYTAIQTLYQTLGGDNLTKLIYGAEGTKGSTLMLPGISAGRVGSAGGTLFGNQFGDSSTKSLVDTVLTKMGSYGFQNGLISTGVFH